MPSVPTPQPCACGGALIAPIAGDQHAIAAAVLAHARTDQRHIAWSSMLHLDRGPLARPAAAATVDTASSAAEAIR
jgi:predicted ATPase